MKSARNFALAALVLAGAMLPGLANAGGNGHHGGHHFKNHYYFGWSYRPHVYQPAYYANPAPWTPGWYRYCAAKYRSFNPGTGYFVGYDGRHHFCR